MSYQNTNQPNGRPPNTARNNQIISDRIAGMSFEAISEKYNLALPYKRKISSEHERKERIKKESEKLEISAAGLYAERDAQMKKFYASLNKKGAMSMFHIDECKAKYGRKAA